MIATQPILSEHPLFFILLTIHIIFGFTALVSSFGALFSAKGQPRHRRFGKFFITGMTGVFITAIPLSIIIHNLFLFLIAIFSYYLAFSGWRYAKNRTGVASKIDWAVSIIMLIAGLIMVGFGIWIYQETPNFHAYILLVFGTIGFLFSIDDLRVYKKSAAVGKERIAKHLGAMLGATIAATTAFSVTNIPIHPSIILWITPTLILSPVILWWKRRILKSTN